LLVGDALGKTRVAANTPKAKLVIMNLFHSLQRMVRRFSCPKQSCHD
jgi:hypothetical protein